MGSPPFLKSVLLFNIPLPLPQILQIEEPLSFCAELSSDFFLSHGKVEFLSLA